MSLSVTGADYSILDAKNAILETSVLQPIGQCPIDGERLVVGALGSVGRDWAYALFYCRFMVTLPARRCSELGRPHARGSEAGCGRAEH